MSGQTGLISFWISKHWLSLSKISVPDPKHYVTSSHYIHYILTYIYIYDIFVIYNIYSLVHYMSDEKPRRKEAALV